MKYLLLPLFCLLGACVRYVPADARVDEEEIRRLLHDTGQQFAAGNFAAARRFYAEDAVLMMPGAPPVHGNAAIQSALEHAFGEAQVKVALEITAVRISLERDMAYVYGIGRVDEPNAAAPTESRNTHWLAVFSRRADGSWCAVADMFTPAG